MHLAVLGVGSANKTELKLKKLFRDFVNLFYFYALLLCIRYSA